MNDIFDRIWERKFAFFGTFFLVFTLSYIILLAIDFLPEPPKTDAIENGHVELLDDSEQQGSAVDDNSVEADSESEELLSAESTPKQVSQLAVLNDTVALPLSLSIEKLGKSVAVLNPTSRNIADLDAALLDGVVRHPDSATLNQEGNVFILGHSSYLPQVFNKNFQAFNGIQNLEWGDMIKVLTADAEYTYRVERVYRASAQDVTVPIAGTGNMLTLATCNSFGSVDDRYIVEAKRVEIQTI